jgi:light-regulated signal transduction histidine kinase (bacteriophytochrome)
LAAAVARAEYEAARARAAEERCQRAEAAARDLAEARAGLEAANSALAQSNDELRQFAFVASHDLQEPLRSISSFCSLLKQECQDLLSAECSDYIDRVVAAAARMNALVAGLLSYARLNLEEPAAFETVDLQDVVEDVLANLHVAVKESGAQITWDPLPQLRGDRVQLVQLVQNLVANAILYRGAEPPRIRIEAARHDGVWEVVVRDNGIGIAPQHHELIFGAFKRLHGRGEYPGAGIGLAVCRKIVERHGGRIWVESSLGQGSAFHFTVPAAGAAAPASEEEFHFAATL